MGHRLAALVGAACLLPLSAGAWAADLPETPPPYTPPVQFGGSWYLRGDIGMTNQSVKDLTLTSAPFPAGFQTTGMGFDSATLMGYRRRLPVQQLVPR